jgi:hypothetical protein
LLKTQISDLQANLLTQSDLQATLGEQLSRLNEALLLAEKNYKSLLMTYQGLLMQYELLTGSSKIKNYCIAGLIIIVVVEGIIIMQK